MVDFQLSDEQLAEIASDPELGKWINTPGIRGRFDKSDVMRNIYQEELTRRGLG